MLIVRPTNSIPSTEIKHPRNKVTSREFLLPEGRQELNSVLCSLASQIGNCNLQEIPSGAHGDKNGNILS